MSKKSQIISFKATEGLKKGLKRLAVKEDRSVSWVITDILKQGIKTRKKRSRH